MSERVPVQNKTSATPSPAARSSSPLLQQRPFSEEQSESFGSNSNISQELEGIQPKTIRRSLNWQNITVEAPSRSNGMSLAGGIQRQPEEQEETPAIEHQVSAKKAEISTGELSNLTRATEGRSVQPKIDRGRLDWRNISVEPPDRSGGEASPHPIQRQQEEPEETPAIQAQFAADSAETSAGKFSNSTIASDGEALQPKIDRAGFNWRNIAIEAPPSSATSSTHPGGIQRQETSDEKEGEESAESLQMQSDGAIQAKCSECEQQEKAEQTNSSVQTKLTVGAPGDKYEQEADSMAAKVMTMPDSALQQPIQRQTDEETEAVQMQPLVNSITPLVQRSSGEEEEIQMKSGAQRASDGSSQASSSIESRLASSQGGGSALPDDVLRFMEPRFGADFSSVRVHTDSAAVQMNKELGAQAFARGSDIYFGAGKSPGKNELTAHELTHTVQQGGASQAKPDQKSTGKDKDNKDKPTQTEVATENPKVKNEGSKEDKKTPTDAGTKTAVKDTRKAVAEVTEKGKASKQATAEKTPTAKDATAKAKTSPDKTATPKKAATDKGNIESNEVAEVNAQQEKVAEQEEAKTAVNETNAGMKASVSGAEQMANTGINFASVPAKPMFATTEEGISALQPEEVLGTAGNNLVLYQTDNPEKSLAAKEAGIAVHKIPEDKAANTRDQQRLQAEAAISKFVASGGQRTAKIAALGTTIEPRIQTATAQAKASVEAAIAQNQAAITNAIGQARTKSTNQAQAAKSQITGQHTTAVVAIQASTTAARQRLQTEYQATLAQLTQIETGMAARIAAPFNTAAQDFRAAGVKVGQEALQIGQTFQNQYAKESPPEPSNAVTEFLESFDRETYVTNWRKAKMDAARDLAANYNSGLIQDANDKANQLAGNQPPVLQGMQDLVAATRTSLQTKHNAALQELNQSEQQAIQTANTTRDSQLQSIDQNLHATLASLQQMQATQLSQVKTTGQQQKLGIDRNAKQVTAVLQQGVNQAGQNLQGAFQQFCTQTQGIKTPNIQVINSVIAEAQTQLDSLTAATQTELENGIDNSAGGIIQQSQQTLESLNTLGQQAAASANNVAEEFTSSMAQEIQSATQAFAQLKSGHTNAVNASADKAVGELKQMTADVGQKLEGVINNLNQKLGESAGQLETGLRGSLANLRSEIPTKADEAAKKVQPAWKSVLKVVIDIVITVAVTVAIAALAASGVGLVAAIGLAALIGAAGALVKQGANDLIDGEMSSWQTYAKEAGIGAATGVLQLVGLRGADKLAGASFLAKSSTFTKGAVKLGVETMGDTAVNITQQLGSGEKFSLAMVGKSFGSSLLSNVGGQGLNSAFGGLGKKLGVSQIENKLVKAGGEFAVDTVKDTAIDVANNVVIEGKDFSADMLRDSTARSALSNVVKGGANKAYGDKLRSLGTNDTTNPTKPITDTPETRPVTIDEPTHKPVADSSDSKPVTIDEPTHKPVAEPFDSQPVTIDQSTHKPVAEPFDSQPVTIDQSTHKPTEKTTEAQPVNADEYINKPTKNEPDEDQHKTSDSNKSEIETPKERSTHHDQPEVEPGIVAKEKAADGHDIKVLKDGRVVRCSDCGEIRKRYANELEQNPHLKQRLDEIEKISEPQEKVKQAQQLEQELAQIAKTTEQRATLKDPNAIDFFDQKFKTIVGDGNNPKKIVAFERYLDATAKRGDGDLEKGLLEDYRKANKSPEVVSPHGEMVSELPRLRQEAENLKGEMEEWLKTNNIKGGERLIRTIDNELKGPMTKMETKGLEATKARIEGFENNLKGVRSEFEQAKTAPPGTEIGGHVKFEGKKIEIDQIRPDGTWINVKNYELFGLNNPKINELITQAEMNLRAAEANLVNDIPPTVVFDFPKGVTPEVAQRLRAIKLNGRHIQVTGKEIPLPQSN
ncbi:eCIS core domain-containing protein [Microcoleus sp. D2_18a_D3]|uniref:eCIS core domain-containing protein n=1 Tax=Microcoleus sp. D2_18a_D3 TaxID=3055330 RepID=UPI002FD19E01